MRNIINIGNSAFEGCESLSTISIPASMTAIGDSTFKNCASLETITIPHSIIEIGNHAFDGCTSLTNTSGPDGTPGFRYDGIAGDWWTVVNRAEQWHNNCPATKVHCSDDECDLDAIAPPADYFYFCPAGSDVAIAMYVYTLEPHYEEVYVPSRSWNETDKKWKNVVAIGDRATSVGAFAWDNNLKKVLIPNTIRQITYGVGIWGDREGAFEKCQNLSEVIISNSVELIDEKTFKDCSSLQNIKIPSSVKTIGFEAFKNSGLKQMDLTDFTDTPPSLNTNVFDGTDKINIQFIVCNEEMKTKFENADNWKAFKGQFIVGE